MSKAQEEWDAQVAKQASLEPGKEWVEAPPPIKGWVRVPADVKEEWDLI